MQSSKNQNLQDAGLICSGSDACFLNGSKIGHFPSNWSVLPNLDNAGMIGANDTSIMDIVSIQATINTFMQRYITPVIICVGVCGNLASLAVFRTSRLRRQTSSIHLSALALSDTGFLITLLFSWLGWFRVYLVHQQPWCVIMVYMSYVCGFLSVWIVVAFTIERFIVSCFPLHRKRILGTGTKVTKIALASLAAGALLAYSFATWMIGVVDVGGKDLCHFYPQYQRVMSIIAHVDTIITVVIPMILIITLNSAITIAVYKTQRSLALIKNGSCASRTPPSYTTSLSSKPLILNKSFRRNNCGSNKKESWVRLSRKGTSSPERAKRHIRSTKMLLIVSTVFILLNLPIHALKLRAVITKMLKPGWMPSTPERLWSHTFELLYYLNFAVNFFLYSLCGQNFRGALFSSCKKINNKMCMLFRFKKKGSPSLTSRRQTLVKQCNHNTNIQMGKMCGDFKTFASDQESEFSFNSS